VSEDEGELFASLSDRLLTAQRRLAAAPPETRNSLQDRLIAITNSAKHDLATASKRLDALLAELPEMP
jgi:hypothetical protein